MPDAPTTTTPAPSTALTPAAPERAPVRLGMAPTNIDDGWRLSRMLAAAGDMVPKQFRDKPEAILVAIQYGIEVGLAPMQALQSIAVIGGRPGLWGDGLLALVIASPVYADHDEYFEVDVNGRPERRDGLTAADLKAPTSAAVCTFVRRGKATPVTRRFSVGQAIKADYLSEKPNGGKEGPWRTHPDRMLQMRARSFAARDAFPDVLRGITTVEELRDLPEDAPPLPAVRVHRLSETPAPAASAAAPPLDARASAVPAGADRVSMLDTIGPVKITRVDHLLGGPLAILDDGSQVWIANADDVRELEKFIGTDHRLRFFIEPIEGVTEQWRARSFELAD